MEAMSGIIKLSDMAVDLQFVKVGKEEYQHSFPEYERRRAKKELLDLYDSSDEELREYIYARASFNKIDIWSHHHPIQSRLIGLTIISIILAGYAGIDYGIYKADEYFSN